MKTEEDVLTLEKLEIRKSALEAELLDIREVIRTLNDYSGGNVNCKDA